MNREEATYEDDDNDDDIFDVASNDDEFEIELDTKDGMTNLDGSPIDKRRMIEAMLEERRLRKQLDDDFSFDDEDDDEDF